MHGFRHRHALLVVDYTGIYEFEVGAADRTVLYREIRLAAIKALKAHGHCVVPDADFF